MSSNFCFTSPNNSIQVRINIMCKLFSFHLDLWPWLLESTNPTSAVWLLSFPLLFKIFFRCPVSFCHKPTLACTCIEKASCDNLDLQPQKHSPGTIMTSWTFSEFLSSCIAMTLTLTFDLTIGTNHIVKLHSTLCACLKVFCYDLDLWPVAKSKFTQLIHVIFAIGNQCQLYN